MKKVIYISDALIKKLNQILQAASTWETQAAKTNQALYQILADCLGMYKQFLADTIAQTDLTDALGARGLRAKKNTPLATKIAYYVFFNSDRRRAYNYGRVIDVADKHNIAPKDFARWIKHKGGIEEIRLTSNRQEVDLPRRKLIELATSSLAEADPLTSEFDLNEALQPNPDLSLPFSVALIRKNPGNGKCGIVWADSDKALVRKVLTVAGQQLVSNCHRQIEEEAERVGEKQKAALISRIVLQAQSTNVAAEDRID